MSINVYDKGDVEPFYAVFRNLGGSLTDPLEVLFIFTAPDGDVTTWTYGIDVEIVRDSQGAFHVYLELTASGDWHYRWECGVNIQGAEQGQFVVRPSTIP